MCNIDELFATAKQLDQPFVAVTDHGSMSGLLVAQEASKRHGVKSIMGCEYYCSGEDEEEGDKKNYHLIVLAKDNVGLMNMMKLMEYAYVKNFYKHPRIDLEALRIHQEGLVVLSACLGGEVAQHIMAGRRDLAERHICIMQEMFGSDYCLEIQPNFIPEQFEVNKKLISIARSTGCNLVATNDVHYIKEGDHVPHEVLLAMQTGKKVSDPKRFKFSTNDFWLKSEKEMMQGFNGLDDASVKRALANTQLIADKCNAEFERKNHLPTFYNIPKGMTERELLVKKATEGLKKKGIKDKAFIKEVQEEINVISRNGYPGYFLIVEDYLNTARENGIVIGDGRGSGAGSKVCWLTGITNIPPHEYDLLFERFMADGREPDIDSDVSDIDAVFEDLQNKYGRENVARIIAFGKMTPKSICRKVLSAFDISTAEINAVSKLIDESAETMESAYKLSSKLCEYKEKHKELFSIIERLQSTISHESQHAGGIIICKYLSSYLPVKSKAEDREKRIVAMDKYMLESLGHFKFDVLGLETLPVIKQAIDSIARTTGNKIDLHAIDLEDKNIYKMLCSGNVLGVFQLSNQKHKVVEQRPKSFRDLIAMNALIRPGVGDWNEYIARRRGLNPTNIIKAREPYMRETYGLITYQEQFLLDAKHIAGWELAYADKHIRKNKNILADIELQQKFINDGVSNGFSREDVDSIWNEIVSAVHGGYSFNKSHSASYAIISYQTAWLKYYYPEHFYAALMTSKKSDSKGQAEIKELILECRAIGIKVLPPNINTSEGYFNVTDDGITYDITVISGLGEAALRGIKKARPFKDFEDFLKRRDSTVKSNITINLIKAGAFDEFNKNRADLLWEFGMHCRTKTEVKEKIIHPRTTYKDGLKMQWEKEALGMYLSNHPMEGYGFKPLSQFGEGSIAVQGGEIDEVMEIKDKNGKDMAFITLNTLYEAVKVIIFSSAWKQGDLKKACKVGSRVMVKGKMSNQNVLCNALEVLE
jgi:DNA polymerase-3 subunit alpha